MSAEVSALGQPRVRKPVKFAAKKKMNRRSYKDMPCVGRQIPFPVLDGADSPGTALPEPSK